MEIGETFRSPEEEDLANAAGPQPEGGGAVAFGCHEAPRPLFADDCLSGGVLGQLELGT